MTLLHWAATAPVDNSRQRAVLVVLSVRSNALGFVVGTAAEIAAAAGCSAQTVRRVLRGLEQSKRIALLGGQQTGRGVKLLITPDDSHVH